MKRVVILSLAVLGAVVRMLAQSGPGACQAPGDVQFVCGQASPEDLAVVPGSEWVMPAAIQVPTARCA